MNPLPTFGLLSLDHGGPWRVRDAVPVVLVAPEATLAERQVLPEQDSWSVARHVGVLARLTFGLRAHQRAVYNNLASTLRQYFRKVDGSVLILD